MQSGPGGREKTEDWREQPRAGRAVNSAEKVRRGRLGKVCAVTARKQSPNSRAASDRHDAAVFSGLQDGPGAAPDPTDAAEIEARRLRLLAGAQSTINELADVLSPLATAFSEAGHELLASEDSGAVQSYLIRKG